MPRKPIAAWFEYSRKKSAVDISDGAVVTSYMRKRV
jgi:hypothetical protein